MNREEMKPTALPYRCHECGAAYCKLWRYYQTFLDHQKLFCVDCALKDQKRELMLVHEDGKSTDDGMTSQTIGWLVPAVPTEDGDTYWGYTSTPAAGNAWWKALPLRPKTD